MEMYKNLPLLNFASAQDWNEWLAANHASEGGSWLQFSKKGSGQKTLTYEEARNAAIAHGWIDGLINKYDASYYMIRFTKRKPNSGWSKINREIAITLIEAGEMQPAGLRHVEAARLDGRWELACDPASSMQVPDDFELELARSPAAQEAFQKLDSANRYAFLYRIQTAKTIQLRAERINQYVVMLEEGVIFHPPK